MSEHQTNRRPGVWGPCEDSRTPEVLSPSSLFTQVTQYKDNVLLPIVYPPNNVQRHTIFWYFDLYIYTRIQANIKYYFCDVSQTTKASRPPASGKTPKERGTPGQSGLLLLWPKFSTSATCRPANSGLLGPVALGFVIYKDFQSLKSSPALPVSKYMNLTKGLLITQE